MRNLLGELKRRNVLRVGAFYIVLAWIILQVASVIFDLIEVPNWAGKLVLALLVLGFPVVLVIAWIFELTPEGIKRESEVERRKSITHQTGRRINLLTGVLAVVAIVMIVLQSVVPGFKPAANRGAPARSDTTAVSGASIAVLPFVNMSSDQEQEYFSDGLAEELLNLLAKVPELTVISRTSSFQFKGKNEDVRVIGQKLGVAHVLEGSVRRSADTVRITAQLINTADGSHVWSESYDRPLANIFALQDEIAGEVVKALRLKLLKAPVTSVPHNAQAYDLLLRARDVYNRRRSPEDFKQAVALVRRAVDIEPGYAQAWAELGWLFHLQASNAFVPYEKGFEDARRAAQRAIELDPNLPEGYAALAAINLIYDWDWRATEQHLERGAAADPANLRILTAKAYLARVLGRADTAIALYHRIADRDPLLSSVHANRAGILRDAGRFAEAESSARRAIELSPELYQMHSSLGLIFLYQGRLEDALREVQAEQDEFWRTHALALVYHALGRKGEAEATLKQFEQCCAQDGAYQLAQLYAFFGDPDTAFGWLERAYQQRDPGVSILKLDRLLDNIKKDPRYVAMLRKLKLPES